VAYCQVITVTAQFDPSREDSKPVKTLQIIAEAMPGYVPDAADPLLNKRIQQFDFLGLASQFEAVVVADPAITSWQLAPYLTEFHLGGSDTQALGGDMAYQYGKFGSLSGLSETEIRAQLSNADFGINSQAVLTAQVVPGMTLVGTAVNDVLTGGGRKRCYRWWCRP